MKLDKKVYIVLIISLVLDQISKALIDAFLKEEASIKIICNFLRFTKVSNTGAAFSILNNLTILLVLISILSIVFLLYIKKEFKNTLKNKIAFGLILGGVIGNLIDRLILGYVRDFLDFNIFGYNYPIFNLADSFIVIGVIILIIDIIFGGKDEVSSKRGK